MLFKLNPSDSKITLVNRVRLSDFGWKEIDMQKLLFENLNRVIQEEDLILIMQSRHWQEEPDLMAVDENGDLWIFELKAWESEEKNILQALRYGQKFGQYDYDDLEEEYQKRSKETLMTTFKKRFPKKEIEEGKFNTNQHFVIITNGLDVKTREAIKFWQNRNLDVRPWIYRIYQPKSNELYVEFNTFRTEDDPFEDIEEGYFIVNTNFVNDERDEPDMLDNAKAAAYFEPWRQYITRIEKGNRVFLYKSGTGIIATGVADSRYKKKDYHDDHDNPKNKNQEYYVDLNNFIKCSKPLAAADIVNITGVNYRFMKTCFAIQKESGEKILEEIKRREKK